MSRLGHLTEQRKQFVEAYCRLGNGTLAAREAGYKDSPSLVSQASKLKRELEAEMIWLVGPDRANLLEGKKSVKDLF